MRLGLGARLAIAFALLAAITALVMAGVASASTDRRINDDIDAFLRQRAADIAEDVRRPDDRPDNRPGRNNNEAAAAAEEVQAVRRAVEADALVQRLDRDGEVSYAIGPSLPITEIDLSYVKERMPPLLRTETIDGVTYRMITRHVDGGGVVQVARDIDSTNLLVGEIRSELILLGLALSGLAGLIGWGVASRTTRPLRRLTSAVEAVRDTGDLSRSVALDRNDEVGRLSATFDELLTSLDESRDQQHRLVQDAAHELRTPITSVRANLDFLERAPDLDNDTRSELLSSIRSEIGELSDLLAEVVELATESRDQATYERVDLATVAEAALAQFEIRSARPVERELASSFVMGDSAVLARAIGNLVANADKYTAAEAEPVRVRVAHGMVTVADRGPGVPIEDRGRMFERFWRADETRSASGSGLGLAIVKKAVDEHGGNVFVRDRPGGGSEIGFSLPSLNA